MSKELREMTRSAQEDLRHKRAELAYLTQQRKKVKKEVKALRRLVEALQK